MPSMFSKGLGDYVYASTLGRSAVANAKQNEKVIGYIQELQNQIKTISEVTSNQQLGAAASAAKVLSSSSSNTESINGKSRWENQGGSQVTVGSINFNTYQVNTDNPAEKDKFKRQNETQIDNAKELNKNLDKIAKQNKKKYDQDTAIKKKQGTGIFSNSNLNKFFRKQKDNISQAVNNIDFSKIDEYKKSASQAWLSRYYTLMDWIMKYKVAEQGFKVLGWFTKVPIKYLIKGIQFIKGFGKVWLGGTLGKSFMKNFTKLMLLFKNKKYLAGFKMILMNPLKWAWGILTAPAKVGGVTMALGSYFVAKTVSGWMGNEFNIHTVAKAFGTLAGIVKNSGVLQSIATWWTNNFNPQTFGLLWDQLKIWKHDFDNGTFLDKLFTVGEIGASTFKHLTHLFVDIASNIGDDLWNGILMPIIIKLFENSPLEVLISGTDAYKKSKLLTNSKQSKKLLNEFITLQYKERTEWWDGGLGGGIFHEGTAETIQNHKDFRDKKNKLLNMVDTGVFGFKQGEKEHAKVLIKQMYSGKINNTRFNRNYMRLSEMASKSEKTGKSYGGKWASELYKEQRIEEVKKRTIKNKKESKLYYDKIEKGIDKKLKEIGKVSPEKLGSSGAFTAIGTGIDSFLEGFSGGKIEANALKNNLSEKFINLKNSSMSFMGNFPGLNLSEFSWDGGNGAISISMVGSERAITYPNGKTKVGGSRSWRANNPGNLGGNEKNCKRLLKKYAKYGAIGCDHPGDGHDNRWRAIVFSSMKGGQAARKELLLKSYGNYSILTIGSKYQKGLNPMVYGSNILKHAPTPIDPNKPIRSFTPAEFNSFLIGMMKAEGFEKGRIQNGTINSSADISNNTGNASFNNISNVFSSIGSKVSDIGSNFFGSGKTFNITGKDGNVASALAKKYADQGIAYVWGGGRGADAQNGLMNGSNAFDCSSFAAMVVNKTYGIPISKYGSTVASQYQFMKSGGGTYINYNEIQPGDILFIFWDRNFAKFPGHTGIAIGEGKMVHASGNSTNRTGYYEANKTGVITANMPSSSQVRAYRIVANAKNNVTGTVMPTTNSDQVFVPGYGMVNNGGSSMNNFQKQLNNLASQLLGLSGNVADITKEQLEKQKPSLSGNISTDTCNL